MTDTTIDPWCDTRGDDPGAVPTTEDLIRRTTIGPTTTELLAAILDHLTLVEAILANATPAMADEITTILADHNDHSGLGGLIDHTQLLAYDIKQHNNNN